MAQLLPEITEIVTKDLGYNFKVVEVICPEFDRRKYRRQPDSKEKLIQLAEKFESYGSTSGHMLGLHKSISGAAGIDKKYGEQDYQFAQRNALRTCMFNAITFNSARNKYGNKPEKWQKEHTAGCIKLYAVEDIQKAILAGKGEERPISRAAEVGGFYGYFDRPAWWRKLFVFEESVIYDKETVKPIMLVLTDPAACIMNAEELLSKIGKQIQERYPSVHTVIKITGKEKPFHSAGIHVETDDDGKRQTAGGEDLFSFYSEITVRAILAVL